MLTLKKCSSNFRNLKWFFLAALIVASLVLIMLFTSTVLDASGVKQTDALVKTIINCDKAVAGLRALVFIAAPVILFFGCKTNKETFIAFWLAVGGAVAILLDFIFIFVTSVPYLMQIIAIVGGLLYSVSIYMFIDGLLERKSRKQPWMLIVTIGLILIVLCQILAFFAICFVTPAGISLAIMFVADTLAIIGNLLCFIGIGQILKIYKNIDNTNTQPEMAEAK